MIYTDEERRVAESATVSANNVHIPDSYKVGKSHFAPIFALLRKAYPESGVWQRTDKSLMREWATHNLCHTLHLWRNRTTDVDLNQPQKWYVRIGYSVVGTMAMVVIKG